MRWPWVTHSEFREFRLRVLHQIGAFMSAISDYADEVDAETNRIAVIVADLQARVGDVDAELAAEFEPVLTRLRGVGVDNVPTEPTLPPGEPTP